MTPLGRELARAARAHWGMYVLEGVELGLFMISAAGFAMLLFHPRSPLASSFASPGTRRLLMGLAMGATAALLIYSPPGRHSGAHMNPAVTLAFLRLGKVAPADAMGYMVAQLLGGTLGLLLVASLAGPTIADASVNYVVTMPRGLAASDLGSAWVGEFAISFVLMSTALTMANRRRTAPFTGAACGALVAAFIFVESPVSGMSMNPARTGASAILSGVWTGWWIYLSAPPLAMLLAAELYVRLAGGSRVYCAKWYHDRTSPCIFRCRYDELRAPRERRLATGPDQHVIRPL